MNTLDDARRILSGCLFIPEEKIDADASINALQSMDSLAFEMIVLEVERYMHREVDPMELMELHSVRDLAGLLEKR